MELNADKLLTLEMLPPGIRSMLGRHLPGVLMFVLVIILAYQLAGVSWDVAEGLLSSADEPPPVVTTNKATAQAEQSKQQDYAYLSDLHLFGKQDETRVVQDVPETAPETRLALVLFGVFSDQDTKKGSAIIGPKSGEQEFYYVGDKVSTGVWLAEVRKDHVLLRRGASYEVLNFPKESSAGFDIQDSLPPSAPDINDTKQSFMENVRIVPVFAGANRELKGYRILPKKDRTVYNRLGLKPSDIVTAINGIALSDQREAMKVISELVKSDSVEVQLERNGQSETKVLNLQ